MNHVISNLIGDEAPSFVKLGRFAIRVGTIYDYIGTHRLKIRRDQGIDSETRWLIVVNALKNKSVKYGFKSIVKLWFKSKKGFWSPAVNERILFRVVGGITVPNPASVAL
jgi:hypothetical protein